MTHDTLDIASESDPPARPDEPNGDDVPMPPDDPARKKAPVKEPPKKDPPQRAAR